MLLKMDSGEELWSNLISERTLWLKKTGQKWEETKVGRSVGWVRSLSKDIKFLCKNKTIFLETSRNQQWLISKMHSLLKLSSGTEGTGQLKIQNKLWRCNFLNRFPSVIWMPKNLFTVLNTSFGSLSTGIPIRDLSFLVTTIGSKS